MTSGAETRADSKPHGFSTTRWSLIVSGSKMGTDERAAQKALAELCHTYWRPIFFFIVRLGNAPEQAQDLTQDFFAMILRENWLQHADRRRGRFRSLLQKSLNRFLQGAHEKKNALRRGGGIEFIALGDWVADSPSHLMIGRDTVERIAPEQLFDVRWAATVVEQALRRLAEECEAKGRRRLFEALSGHLTALPESDSHASVAATLGVSEAVVKKQLYNLRLRFRWLLRQEVARTVGDPADIEEEIRYLCAALVAGSARPTP